MADTEPKSHAPTATLFADAGVHISSDSCVDSTVQTALVFGAGGLLWGQLQNMFRNPPIPIKLDIATVTKQIVEHESRSQRMAHMGRTSAFFAVTGATFSAANCAAASFRGKDDYGSKAVAGCAAGLVMGFPSKRVPQMLALCAGLGTMMGAIEIQRESDGSVVFGDKEKWRRKVLGLSTPEDAK